MFNTISSSLQHTIPPSIFSFKGFPHLHTITNHLISSLKDQDPGPITKYFTSTSLQGKYVTT